MLDVILVVGLAALVLRGWMRGLVREAVGLATLVVGTFLGFRLSTPVGHGVGAVTGMSPEVSRLLAGFMVFTAVSIAGAVVARFARRGINILPGLPTVDRLGGAVLGGGAGLIVATLLLTMATLIPLPAALADSIAQSRFADTLTDPTGSAQQALEIAGGDGALGVVLRLDELVGAPRIGDPGDEVVVLPTSEGPEAVHDAGATAALRRLVNRERVTGGAAPLARGATLDRVARAQSRHMYREGRMAHVDADGAGPSQRLDRAGIPHVVVAELIGLGATPEAVVHAWLNDDRSRATLLTGDVRRLGVAAYAGPLGLMMVMVAAG